MKIAVRVLVGWSVLSVASVVHAQFFYSPPPTLMGQPSYHLYSVPGVIEQGGLETFFACTNATSANIRVGVEIFGFAGGAAGNDPSATSLDILPGGTVFFGTGAAVGIAISSNVGGGIAFGSARILATAKKGIICTAFVADASNAPPATSWQLTIIKGTKQKAAN